MVEEINRLTLGIENNKELSKFIWHLRVYIFGRIGDDREYLAACYKATILLISALEKPYWK